MPSIYDPKYYLKNKETMKKSSKNYREQNAEKIRIRDSENYLLNKEKILLERKKYYQENLQKQRNRKKIYRELNPEKYKESNKKCYAKHAEKRKKAVNIYRKNNSAKINALVNKRRCLEIRATPKWITKDQLNEMEEFYILAKELEWLGNEKLEVDHIIPLNGKNVKGLHVPWNLQILPRSKNREKSNKLIQI